MTSKKHFERAAQIVKQTENRVVAGQIAEAYLRLFIGDNPLFDRGRFLKACGL